MTTSCHFIGIRQKSEFQNGHNKKTKHVDFPKNENFLPPDLQTYVLPTYYRQSHFAKEEIQRKAQFHKCIR